MSPHSIAGEWPVVERRIEVKRYDKPTVGPGGLLSGAGRGLEKGRGQPPVLGATAEATIQLEWPLPPSANTRFPFGELLGPLEHEADRVTEQLDGAGTMWDRDEILDFGGHQVGFSTNGFRPIDALQEVQIVKRLFATLTPLIQPIALDAWVCCTDAKERILADWDVFPPQPTWRLRESSPFAWDATRERVDIVTHVAPTIDADTIERWLRDALAQEMAGKLVYPGYVHMYASRARLVSDWRRRQQDLLFFDLDNHRAVKIPVETRRDGRWVSGPGYGVSSPPIDVAITSGDGGTHVSMTVTWTPWVDRGTPEYEALCACLRSIVGPEWTYSGGSPMFDFLR